MGLVAQLVSIGLSPQQATFLGHTQSEFIVANGTTQGAATALTSTLNRIGTCTAGVNDSVRLPFIANVTEKLILVRNDTAANGKVFPESGEFINNLGLNNGIVLPANTGALFFPTGSSRWNTIGI